MNNQVRLLSVVVLDNLHLVVVNFHDGAFVRISPAVVRGRKESDHLGKLTVLPNVGFESFELGLVSSYNRDELILLKEFFYCFESEVVGASS